MATTTTYHHHPLVPEPPSKKMKEMHYQPWECADIEDDDDEEVLPATTPMMMVGGSNYPRFYYDDEDISSDGGNGSSDDSSSYVLSNVYNPYMRHRYFFYPRPVQPEPITVPPVGYHYQKPNLEDLVLAAEEHFASLRRATTSTTTTSTTTGGTTSTKRDTATPSKKSKKKKVKKEEEGVVAVVGGRSGSSKTTTTTTTTTTTMSKAEATKADRDARRQELCYRQKPIKVSMVTWAVMMMEEIEEGSAETFIRSLEDDQLSAVVEEPSITWALQHKGRGSSSSTVSTSTTTTDSSDLAIKITKNLMGVHQQVAIPYDRERFLTLVNESLLDAEKRRAVDPLWSPIAQQAFAYLADLSDCIAKYSHIEPAMHVTKRGKNLEWCEPIAGRDNSQDTTWELSNSLMRLSTTTTTGSTSTSTSSSRSISPPAASCRVPVVVNVKVMESHRTTEVGVLGDDPPLDKAGRIEVLVDVLSHPPFSTQIDMVDSYPPVDFDSLLRCTSPSYLYELHALSSVCTTTTGPTFKLGQDTHFSAGTLRAAYYSAGGAIEGVRRVHKGAKASICLLRPAGHHASSRGIHPSPGHCFFNNVAIAAEYARRHLGYKRIAVIDFDVHHGNGTEDDTRSINQSEGHLAMYYFSVHTQMGYPVNGPGKSKQGNKSLPEEGIYNYPLPHLTKVAFHDAMAEISRIVKSIIPDLVFISSGFDGHALDPVGAYLESEWDHEDFGEATRMIMEMAKAVQCPVVSCLEGGYNPFGGHDSPLAMSFHSHAEEIIKAVNDPFYTTKTPVVARSSTTTTSSDGGESDDNASDGGESDDNASSLHHHYHHSSSSSTSSDEDED